MKITKKICKVRKQQKQIDGVFPKEWGKLQKAMSGISLAEYGNDWCYTWCLHFENGVLPIIVRHNNLQVEINEDLFEATQDRSYNNAAYNMSLLNPVWVNVYAKSEGSCITYCRGSKVVEKVGYTQAMNLLTPWNGGAFLPATDKFDFVISNELLEVFVQENLVGIWRHG
ncbi:MAG: hypothetical protein ILA52_02850 [Alphaproteobacteria bacterium]|nr:hypothetical protein [Alphaproteobacteria bacterium]